MKFEEAVKHLKNGKCIKKHNSPNYYKFDGTTLFLFTEKGYRSHVTFGVDDLISNNWEIMVADSEISLHKLLHIIINFTELFDKIHINKTSHKATLITSEGNLHEIEKMLFPYMYSTRYEYNDDTACISLSPLIEIRIPFRE